MLTEQQLLRNLQTMLFQQKSNTQQLKSFRTNDKKQPTTTLNSMMNQLIRINFNIFQTLQKVKEHKNQPPLQTQTNKKSKYQKPPQSSKSNTNPKPSDIHISALKQCLANLKLTCEQIYTQYFTITEKYNKTRKEHLYSLDDQYFVMLAKSYCLVIVLKLQLQINISFIQQNQDHYNVSSVQEEVYRIQSLLNLAKKKQQISLQISPTSLPLSAKIVKLCLNQILNLQSINQYEYYNVNSNQQFKFDQNTQQSFLYILAFIKLSSHLKFFSFHKKTFEEIKLIQKIYQEGKDTLAKLQALSQNNYKNQTNPIKNNQKHQQKQITPKHSCIEIKSQQIKKYFDWVEPNWIQLIRQKLIKKSSNNQFQQLPVQFMSIYEVFFIIHKLSQFQQQYMQKIDKVKVQFQSKSQILRNAQQKKITIKKNLQILRNKQNFPQLIKQKDISQNRKIQSLLQWALKQIQIYMKKCEDNCDKITLEKLQNLINHDSLCQIIKSVQKRPTIQQKNKKQTQLAQISKFTKSILVNEADFNKLTPKEFQKKEKQTSILNTKNLQKKKINDEDISHKDKKDMKFFQNLQNQSIIEPIIPQNKSPRYFLNRSMSILSNGNFTQKKCLTFCMKGQYLVKFNFNNNSYAKKFVKLSKSIKAILWADKKEQINDSSSQQKLNKIYGIVYGDVTPKVRHHCQLSNLTTHYVEPWKCFSLICKNRTLDFHCEQNQIQVFYWLIGLSSYLREEKKIRCNFTVGKMLWKKMLLKLRFKYLDQNQSAKKKDKKRFYLGKYNARAILNYGKSLKTLENKNFKYQLTKNT